MVSLPAPSPVASKDCVSTFSLTLVSVAVVVLRVKAVLHAVLGDHTMMGQWSESLLLLGSNQVLQYLSPLSSLLQKINWTKVNSLKR